MLLFPNKLLPTQCFRKLNEVVLCVFACQLEQPGQQDVGGQSLQVEQTAPLWIQCVSCWHWAQLDWPRPQCGHCPGSGGLAWGRSPLCPVVQAPWRESLSARLSWRALILVAPATPRERSQTSTLWSDGKLSDVCSFFLFFLLKSCIFNVTSIFFHFKTFLFLFLELALVGLKGQPFLYCNICSTWSWTIDFSIARMIPPNFKLN